MSLMDDYREVVEGVKTLVAFQRRLLEEGIVSEDTYDRIMEAARLEVLTEQALVT